MTMIVSYCY
uniref:Uncharacterized protein n=1 Tax=Anguilla anguilla TaxID=7936 RepID=A0A0E9TXY8_ANGAN